ncbi:MAG: mannose-1-phosphate guanylyltransferase/mannose-6-phosphate isomerase [Thermodesulfovibrionales bacterium]
MKTVILAGGSGTRLWPLSRKSYPKQFLKINGAKSLFQQTVERILHISRPEDIIIMTNRDYKFHIIDDIKSLGHKDITQNPEIIIEPVSRNTAPAIALAVKYCMERSGCSGEDIIFVCPSDHIIRPVEKFKEYIEMAKGVAKEGYIITFGIKPNRPDTGYGYIKINSKGLRSQNRTYFDIERFVEKPNENLAKRFIDEGCYFWNSGMFMFRIDVIMDEMKRHAPDIFEILQMDLENILSHFESMPEISIDYAVMERSKRIALVPVDIYWNDVGSWDSLYEAMERDENGNALSGNIISIDTKNSLIFGDRRLVSTIGLEDMLVVETADAILIAKKGETQKVKEIVNRLKMRSRKEVEEHVTTYKPWGSYTVLEEGPRYKIKRIVVNPKQSLSLQLHHHRSEHWVVVRGTAKITIGEKIIFIHENESAYVPKSTPHRLENPGKIPLEIIEVQNGEYTGEDDIERIDDPYGR